MNDIAAQAPDLRALFATASEQAGYSTAAQAHICGYSKQLLAHHAANGRFIRVRRGLYRLRDYPSSRHEEVMIAWLAVGRDSAVISHESALDLHDLSDVVPNHVHLIIPRSRRGLAPMRGAALHTEMSALSPSEIVIREGMRVTEPARTILDCAGYGTGPEQVVMAIEQARRRGWIVAAEFRARARERPSRVVHLVALALDTTYHP